MGWTATEREQRLHLVVNNARFLILPWVRCPNLTSSILARAAKRLADDWQQRYASRPVLLETFVELPRFTGTAYKAANWQRVGVTQGRGKLDVHHRANCPRNPSGSIPCGVTSGVACVRRKSAIECRYAQGY